MRQWKQRCKEDDELSGYSQGRSININLWPTFKTMQYNMKITRLEKSKIYRPKKTGSLNSTNVITCNMTTPDGNVKNVSEINAALARDWVDENQK